MNISDPYNREELIDVLVSHAWERRAEDFLSRDIQNEAELRSHIEHVIENENTEAFRCQTQPERGHNFCREVYNLDNTFRDEATGKDYCTTIVLNPNRDENGHYFGGSIWIRDENKNELKRLVERELDKTGEQPELVVGGRQALREQEAHRQLEVDKTKEQEKAFDLARYLKDENYRRTIVAQEREKEEARKKELERGGMARSRER